MKVSIITVVYNGGKYIKDCVESVLAQTYDHIEYVVIDGASSDQTLEILMSYQDQLQMLISEPDLGMYDALNKGINMATGDIIGVLNADDWLASNTVIEEVVKCFKQQPEIQGVYGNLNYISKGNPKKVIRNWVSKKFTKLDFQLGWMPAHPTLYLKKKVFDQYGKYSLSFGTAADYEFMTRLLYRHKVKVMFLDQLIVNMRNGGASNASIKARWQAIKYDYKAMKDHHFPFPSFTLLLKKASKISQFIIIKT